MCILRQTVRIWDKEMLCHAIFISPWERCWGLELNKGEKWELELAYLTDKLYTEDEKEK
jgi:hypothetical protein